jgi:transposase
MQITTIALDLAKHWFQVHGVDANGHIVVRKRLWRSAVIPYFRSLEPCLVGHGSLRNSASLGARADRVGAYG